MTSMTRMTREKSILRGFQMGGREQITGEGEDAGSSLIGHECSEQRRACDVGLNRPDPRWHDLVVDCEGLGAAE